MTNENPWLWAVYVVVGGLPLAFLLYYCFSSSGQVCTVVEDFLMLEYSKLIFTVRTNIYDFNAFCNRKSRLVIRIKKPMNMFLMMKNLVVLPVSLI